MKEGNCRRVGNTGSSFFSSSVLQMSLGHEVPLLPSTITGGAGIAEARKQSAEQPVAAESWELAQEPRTHQSVLSSCFFMVFVNLWQGFENYSCCRKKAQ